MRIVVVGAGAVGRSIANELLSHGHDVTVMDSQTDKMQVSEVADADWILADACSPDSLAQAGVGQADVMVAATGDDKANLVISLLSKSEFGVPRTVARVNNPKNEWMFTDQWGVDVSVSTPRVMTSLVEEAVSTGALVHLFTFYTSGTSIYSVTVPDGAAVVGKRVADLEIPHTVVLSAIIRDSYPMDTSDHMFIEGGDRLLFLFREGADEDFEVVSSLFSGQTELPFDPAQED